MKKEKAALPNLETSLAEMSQLIDKMEHGELTLEESLTQFERGITLVKHCQKILEQAEQKVQILMQQNGKQTLTDFDTDEKGRNNDSDSE